LTGAFGGEALRATARAGANIAFIKYWGNRDSGDNLPLNSSLSMTLSDAVSVTTVAYDPDLQVDEIYLDGERLLDHRAHRVVRHLDRIRSEYYSLHARVVSVNSFPAGTGMASSASGFAALTAAAIAAFGEGLPDPRALSVWARRASGSAARSILGGFVEWHAADSDEGSFAEVAFDAEWWDLRDVTVIVSADAKVISSTQGHRLAGAHPFMPARQRQVEQRLPALKAAMLRRDFAAFGALLEQESLEMHAVMISSTPSCLYLTPGSVAFLHAVRRWRDDGVAVAMTLDAGPNPHLICPADHEDEVLRRSQALAPGATVVRNRPGAGVTLLEEHLI